MRRLMAIAAAVLMLGVCSALAEDPGLSISVPGEEIRPGRPVVVSFTVPEDGTCSISLEDETGAAALTVTENRAVTAGYNAMYWNGTCNGAAVPEGTWRMILRMGGRTAETPVAIGRMIPCLISARTLYDLPEEGAAVLLAFYATESGTLTVQDSEGGEPLFRESVSLGEGEISFPAALSPGEHRLALTLTGEDGTVSEPVLLELEVRRRMDADVVPEPEPLTDELRKKAENGFTPAQTSPYRGEDLTLNYWTLPMDITDEKAVWKALTAPITVLDNGKKNAEKTQVVIRSKPSEDSDGVGVVTCISQGVHVLERGEEWTLIECYSSSFHDSVILNWNVLVQGYVPTAYLTVVKPNQELGLVVDKLTQRLYVFRHGRLYSTVLVSTGIANSRQPYNETRSGEFLLVSKVGEFSSDNLKCALALRFNDGDLLHEVPYLLGADGKYRNYSVNEPKLGTKASHGCIRVQRQESPEGVNQKWLWNHYQKNTRIIIWEDWQGRQIPVPEDDTTLYCLKRNANYHTTDRCSAVLGKKLEKLTYGQLGDKEYRKLKPCPICAAPSQRETIEAINQTYAEGGDHDPVLTKARKKCPRKQKGK